MSESAAGRSTAVKKISCLTLEHWGNIVMFFYSALSQILLQIQTFYSANYIYVWDCFYLLIQRNHLVLIKRFEENPSVFL